MKPTEVSLAALQTAITEIRNERDNARIALEMCNKYNLGQATEYMTGIYKGCNMALASIATRCGVNI